jgi:hypothetical protein
MEQKIEIDDVTITLEKTEPYQFPSAADCNSPVWWHDGVMHVLTATGHPILSTGKSLKELSAWGPITFTGWRDGGRWIESVHQEDDGILLGWYHNEPAHLVPEELQEGRQFRMTAPFIGAAISYDQGKTWDDLGLVLAGDEDTLELEHYNFWFAGGNGDFTVILDREQDYFYFLFSGYYKDTAQQGICLARMRHEHRFSPVGKVMKWHLGKWDQPGLLGELTPIFPVKSSWYNEQPDAFWGPSVHWNTTIQKFVILLNRAIDPTWKQGGIYISIADDLADPARYTQPVLLLEHSGWYPQIIGCRPNDKETDREAGQNSRLFIHGHSNYLLSFSRED